MNKIISIITDWGGEYLASGHIQRMANLAVFLNLQEKVDAYIINKNIPGFIKDEHKDYFRSTIPNNSHLIIRDMRDSEITEINELKESGKVLAIDDLGPGADIADYKVNLLPSIQTNNYKNEYFIYGYNFTQSLKNLKNKIYSKNIDLCIYPGPENKVLEKLLDSMPKNYKIAILGLDEPYVFYNNNKTKIFNPYPETLFSSKLLLSHFGITLFEAQLCRCKLLSLNPTNYHSKLANVVKNDMNLINLGLWKNFNNYDFIIEEIENFQNNKEINISEINDQIVRKLNNFYKFLLMTITNKNDFTGILQ